MWLAAALLTLLSTTPARADNRFIVRSTLGSSALTQLCLLQNCTVAIAIDGTLNQVFLLTTPTTIDPTTFLTLLRNTPGIVAAELDQVLSLVGGLNAVTTPPAGLTDSSPANYFGNTVWNGYANQPASGIVHVQDAQNTFKVSGKGIVADIDTGVDPNHPALKSVLLAGYDFTRNQPGGSEMTDFTSSAPSPCPSCQPAIVNQSTAAVLDQSTAAVLDGNLRYAAFGHGTMVMGVIHLVAPNAQNWQRTISCTRRTPMSNGSGGRSAGVGVWGFGSMLAITLSWSGHHSILWMIVHGIFSWFYVAYYAWLK